MHSASEEAINQLGDGIGYIGRAESLAQHDFHL